MLIGERFFIKEMVFLSVCTPTDRVVIVIQTAYFPTLLTPISAHLTRLPHSRQTLSLLTIPANFTGKPSAIY